MSRRAIVRAVLLGAAAGLVTWVFGVQGPRPVLIGACVAAGTAAVLSIPPGWYGTWPARPRPASGGGSGQVWRLANRLRRFENDDDPARQQRLRALAAARLRRLGLDWDDPRAVQALGPDVHAALSAQALRPSLSDVDAVVTAIERLDAPSGGTRP
ncbi:hypothetical protein [Jiangella rhizosphaerae]|uniref:Uncharacterized protein n=1 Tax=Jiangella rhizosphaerae TaxID=2293569 RepID=A0A418KKR9_9ACTN|nr:hypothetical protein [Jiangella rhizosphaerae]RIQ16368.1 hypothetical protein DY240_22900 [Jiangella rhizosphaerae]